MDPAQLQRGQNEQYADPFKGIPEETGDQWRAPPAKETDQHDDEGHGHGKRSMLNKMKDKAKTLKTSVKKKITPSHEGHHEESHEEIQEDSHEASSEEEEGEDVEEQHQTENKTDGVQKTLSGLDSFGTRQVLRDDSKSSVQHITAEKYPHISSNKEEMPTEETLNLKTGGVNTEASKSNLGLGKVQQIQEQGGEERPLSTKFDDNGRGECKSAEDNFQTTPENTEPGKAWNQSSSEGADRGKGNWPEKPGEEQFQSPEGKVNENVKETPEKVELGKTWSEKASEGLGFAKEKLQGYGVFKGIKSAEKPEESQSSLGNAQDKVSEIGEAKEIGSDMKSPNYTEEMKTDPSETGNNKAKDTVIEGERKEIEDEGTQQQQSGGEGKAGQSYVSKIYAAKDAISSKLAYGGQTNQESNVIEETKPDDQIQGKEMCIDKKSPNDAGEIITGPSETAPGYAGEASKLAEEFKKVLSFDQTSSNDKAKDSVIEGDHKKNEDEGTQQQLSGGEGKAGQGYVSKIYSAKDAISSKLGYGGQTNREPNVTGESKPADQIQGTATESMEGAKESKETFKSTIASKLSPGEHDKALSDVITGAVSNSAKSLKDSLGGLYGGNGKVSTTDTNIGTSTINNQSTASNPSGGKGIVDRVTGVVGSFFGSKQGDNSDQHSALEKLVPKSQVQVEEQVQEVPKF
ncbi:low-temperature-induced 65 kDa protein [Cryptomeria japonica]|uniref:low-temperature-induced 65 kDa protein n=1 Tax=Cryptomeria japonica TaxID=3369 RepID=UPI0027D9E734|nr:low-temperature-induced 65 kDa protein [Cryptomeria japonica]